MRSPEEMLFLIKSVAEKDEKVRSVIISGSRTNADCPNDVYQDFDIVYLVTDISPYRDNDKWIEANFGRPILMQKPESMSLIPPDNNGNFVYLMIFSDGNRIDLTVTEKFVLPDGEPAYILLDKDNALPGIKADPAYWYVKKPSQKEFDDCANEFHWCLNNVAKGIARDEVPYAMEMLNTCVRDMLVKMISWYIGAEHGFGVSVGKCGKYFKKYLPPEMYSQYISTYTAASPEAMWSSAYTMISLFGNTARKTAILLGYVYNEAEENGIIAYMDMVKNGLI